MDLSRFAYVDDDGTVNAINSEDVNDYLREIAGDDFSAKDFRTWVGTVECIRSLALPAAPRNERDVLRMIDSCRKSLDPLTQMRETPRVRKGSARSGRTDMRKAS